MRQSTLEMAGAVTPLHNAVHGGDPQSVEDLLEIYGADASLADAGGKTALHWACGDLGICVGTSAEG